jgi:hypothetical protein
VQFRTGSLGKKGCSPIFSSLFFFLVIYCPNAKIEIQILKKKGDFEGFQMPKVRNKTVKIPILNRVKCPMTDQKPVSKHLFSGLQHWH